MCIFNKCIKPSFNTISLNENVSYTLCSLHWHDWTEFINSLIRPFQDYFSPDPVIFGSFISYTIATEYIDDNS